MFTTEEQGYTLEDSSPLASAYYRLRSVDYDGSAGFSDILQLERVSAATLRAYPNPVGDRLELSLEVDAPTAAQLVLMAADGRIVVSRSQQLVAGLNQLSVDLSSVPAGVYLLRMGEYAVTVIRR